MKAILLTIGDEILIGQILNSNTQWMSEKLTDLGIEVSEHLTVGDREEDIARVLKSTVGECDFLIIGGGLGPTHDDVTMETLSRHFKVPLQYDEEWVSRIEVIFKDRGRVMSENNKKQGYLLKDAIRIDNDCGTAAGQHFQDQKTEIFVVPGVPHEMMSMMNRYILPFVVGKNPQEKILKRSLLTTGIGESALADRLDPFVQKIRANPNVTLAFLPSTTQVKLRLQMKSLSSNASAEFDGLSEELRRLCGEDFFGFDPSTIEEVILTALKSKRSKLALAESCTGGLIAHRLTQIPGCSEVLQGSLVLYQNELKQLELGISSELLQKNGAVSEEIARAMADGVRKKWGSTFGLATTGYLGPTGGDERAPLGTVWIALSSAKGITTRKFRFESDRMRAKERAAQAALDLLRRSLDASSIV